ncbi:MAG: hypothetical protein HUJ97_07015, partial [Bacteroidales bacterium]|nr:hypothetical protein [Bacteroidales bacterium]
MNTFIKKLLFFVFLIATIYGCAQNDPFGEMREQPAMPDPMGGGGGGQPGQSGQADASGNDLK